MKDLEMCTVLHGRQPPPAKVELLKLRGYTDGLLQAGRLIADFGLGASPHKEAVIRQRKLGIANRTTSARLHTGVEEFVMLPLSFAPLFR
jgi:hypothetical protein